MFTTCPACRMNLAVTAMDLRVGQGYVRCGRCERVFNALLSLSEDLDPEQQSGHTATGTTTMPALEDDVAAPAVASQTARALPESAAEIPPDDGEWARITPIHSAPTDPVLDLDVVDSQATGTFETIVLEGEGYLQTEEHVDEEELDEQLEQIARQIGDADVEDVELPAVDVEEAEQQAVEPAEIDADAAVGNRPRSHWGWGVAAGLLLLLLIGQVVHHNRQALVASPLLERPLQATYGAFGVTLEPAWNLKAYDLRQLGGEALGASSTIVLRASVHNRAPASQPPPLIRAVLQDRYGNAVSTMAIAPQDYLRGTPPARMAPDQRLDAELRLEDPNRQAVGFELDACLPAADGTLHCSNDP